VSTNIGMKTKPIMTARQKLEMETTWKLRYPFGQSWGRQEAVPLFYTL
jgi:hypothetical protein